MKEDKGHKTLMLSKYLVMGSHNEYFSRQRRINVKNYSQGSPTVEIQERIMNFALMKLKEL